MTRIFIVAGVVAGLAVPMGALAETLSGPAKVISGDLIEVGGKQVYLNGVVAPEGPSSKFSLESLLGKKSVSCKVQAVSQGSKPTAVCTAGSKDLSVELVSIGGGVSFEENGVNLVSHALQVKPSVPGLSEGLTPPRDCLIKGNKSQSKISDSIFHMPGDPHYLRTKIDVKKGETWFCSEEDAIAAGFRRAGAAQ